MAEIEKKISILTPKEELYALWREAFLKDGEEMRADHPDRHPFNDFFSDYQLAEEGLNAGTISKAELDELLGRFDKYGGDLSDISIVASFWHLLSLEYPQVDGELALLMWRWGLEQEKDPFHKAESMVSYVETAKPSDGAERLMAVADELREVLPTHQAFSIIYPAGKNNNPTMEETLGEIDSFESRPRVDDIRKVGEFVNSCRRLGVELSDLDDYLLEALEEVNLGNCNGYVARYLISHLANSSLPREEKERRLAAALDRASNLPRGLGFYDTVLEGAVDSYLILGDFEAALRTWKEIEQGTCATCSFGTLVRYAFKLGRAAELRAEYSGYQKRFYEGHDESAWELWTLHWYLAARSLADNGRGFFLNEPEVVWWVDSEWSRGHLAEIWKLCVDERYKDEARKLRLVVQKHVEDLIDKFNASELDELESRDLLEILIAMAG